MPQILDPLAAAERIDRDYRSYLATTFAPADRAIAAEFRAALEEPERTRKGPFLQVTPPYRPGATPSELAVDGVLSDTLVTGGALPPRRPLYAHQETALRKLAVGRNLVVATGTGSGKTECYLTPILQHLLDERDTGTLARPGVRALLLYPMNALVNDQLKRLREFFAPYDGITFGRYTGETRHTNVDALARYREQLRHDPPAGELIDREQMQQTPPHVLVTNFAMLEYLLLRPADSTLFDGPTGRHWRFVVLDEVHVYDGAKGAEVGMLLRRVRDRVHHSERGRLTCIGTSATLGGGRQDAPLVAEFATQLFDEPFEVDDVVHPERLPLAQHRAEWSITGESLAALHSAWRSDAAPGELFTAAGVDGSAPSVADALHRILHAESHLVELQHRLESGSRTLSEVADVFDDASEPVRALVQLVDLAIAARPDEESASLLPARYHVWLSASEGMFLCLHPEHPGSMPRLTLDRHVECEACRAAGVEARAFEVAVCRHCRTRYLVGVVDHDDRFVHAPSFQRDLVHLLPGELVEAETDIDEDEDALSPEERQVSETGRLCVSCGVVTEAEARCGCDQPRPITVTNPRPGGRPQPVTRCVSCKRHASNGITQRFLTGSEAPVAVVATSVYQSLPPDPNASRRATGNARKLLMFSDSRQDAAFFAPYLRRTYGRAIERHAIWNTLADERDPYRFDELLTPVLRASERSGLLDEDDSPRANRTEVTRWLLAEVLATDRRQSLDGLGLAEIGTRVSAKLDPPRSWEQLGLGDSFEDTVWVLLDSVRQSAAVTVPDDVDVRADLRFAPRNTTTRLRGSGSEPGVLAWLPGRGANRRTDYLRKVLERRGLTADSAMLLRDLWDALTEPGGPMHRALMPIDDKQFGTVFALNHEQIEFRTHESGAIAYQCDTCRHVWWRSVNTVCPTFKCEGTLAELGKPLDNHYSSLYRRVDPIALRVEEHTGQLQAQHAAELQEQFVRGELNALSCSTTFELGVDVGEVQSILLRNVPPSASNYVQRAGRAGRRAGSAALVVAFAQRRSHDRSFYRQPHRMIDGHVPPPLIQIENEAIVRRHVHAVAWADFERDRVDRGGQPSRTVADLLDEPDGSIPTQFVEWLRSEPARLLEALVRLTPPRVAESLGIARWDWVDRLVEPDAEGVGGWLIDLEQRTLEDRQDLMAIEDEASAKKQHGQAQAAQRTRRSLEGRRVLDVFAQRGVLPKYGFPVDVVEMDLSRSRSGYGSRLDLNRDLRMGILEFAPGGQLVAGNHLWRSVGIRQLRGRRLPEWEWGICDGCAVLRTALTISPGEGGDGRTQWEPCEHCGSVGFERGQRGRFVQPLYGFIGTSDGEPGESRPMREGHLETHFAEFSGPPPDDETVELGGTPFVVRQSRRGWITVFNRGRGGRRFAYCSSCGHASDAPQQRAKRTAKRSGHTPPWGGDRPCNGTIRPIDLGHRFMTSVIELTVPLPAGPDRDDAAMSALYGLIGAAPAIGIAEADIGGSLAVGRSGSRTLVIFDDVPGGAGHTRFMRDRLDDLVQAAADRLDGCECGADTSCYSCLRSYRNQQVHDRLVRSAGADVLRQLLGNGP